jgi:hypothetical protein
LVKLPFSREPFPRFVVRQIVKEHATIVPPWLAMASRAIGMPIEKKFFFAFFSRFLMGKEFFLAW